MGAFVSYATSDLKRAWIAVLGPPVAWFSHLAFGSIIGEAACVKGEESSVWLGFSGAQWALVVLTLLALSLCLFSVRLGWKVSVGNPEGTRFMARIGLILGTFLMVVIVAQAFPILGGC